MIKISKICTKDDLALFKRFMNECLPLSDDSLLLGASINDIPCGALMADTKNKNNGTCDVEFLFVHPQVRRMGVATKLLNTLIEKAKKLKCNKVIVKSVKDMKTINEVSHFFKNHKFNPVEIESNVWSITPKHLYESGRIKEFTNRKITIPKNIDICPLEQIDKNLLASLKEKKNIDYEEIYAPFPENDRVKLKHINTFFAVHNSDEIVGWIAGLDAFGKAIHYRSMFVKEKYRNLALGYTLENICMKNHIKKYSDRSILFAIAVDNKNMFKFSSLYYKGINKDIRYEFRFTKNL